MNSILSQKLLRFRERQASVSSRRWGRYLAGHQAIAARNRTQEGHAEQNHKLVGLDQKFGLGLFIIGERRSLTRSFPRNPAPAHSLTNTNTHTRRLARHDHVRISLCFPLLGKCGLHKKDSAAVAQNTLTAGRCPPHTNTSTRA